MAVVWYQTEVAGAEFSPTLTDRAISSTVISPSWSIHSGAKTSDYTFFWGMAGENQTCDDMDQLGPADLK